jgi:hypothetical protein
MTFRDVQLSEQFPEERRSETLKPPELLLYESAKVLNGARFIIFTFEWRSFSLITVEIKSSIIISFSSASYLYIP